MRKSSWIILGICIVLIFCLGFAYFLSQGGSENLSHAEAEAMVKQMQVAVRHKDINTIMNYLAPGDDVRVANMKSDQIRVNLARAFQAMPDPRAEVNNLTYSGGSHDATIGFDLAVHNDAPGQDAIDYTGHITLQLQRVVVPHLLGLFRTHEWRIVGGTSTGPDPNNYGDY